MKENIWAKTILSVYRYLERICDSIDKMVENKALGSFYVCSSNFSNSSIFSIADSLIALGERKKTLINIKVLTCDTLKKCDRLNAQILIEKYIDGDKSEDIANRHNIPIRTYFRKLTQAEKDFSKQMAELGFSDNKLNEYLADEKWILEVYSRFLDSSRGEGVQVSENRLKKLALS